MTYRKVLIFLALICCTIAGHAQHYLGVATGATGAINSLYLNPANIAASQEKVEVNLSSINAAVDNDQGKLISLSDIGRGDANAFTFSSTKAFSMLVPVLETRLPGVMISLDDKLKQSFALTVRARGIYQFTHFDPTLYNTITSGNYSAKHSYNFVSNNFNMTAHVWNEIGFTYGLQVFNSGPHTVKAGVTLRYLVGIDYLVMKGKNLDVSYTEGSDSLYAKNSDIEFSSNVINSKEAQSSGIKTSDVLSSLFGARAGSGFGMDIGVTYSYDIGASDEFGPKDDGTEGHRITGSVAVTDIGAIKYKEGDNFFVNVTGNGYLTGKGLSDNLDNWNKLRSYLVTQNFSADTGSRTEKLYMPTSIITGVDYQVHGKFFVNATFIGNLANRNRAGNSLYNWFTVAPRYDRRLFAVSLPVTYSSFGQDIKLGIGCRVTGFFFGSDDMLALFSRNQHGFGFYFGGFVPIYRHGTHTKEIK
jgi:hypothetical protein